MPDVDVARLRAWCVNGTAPAPTREELVAVLDRLERVERERDAARADAEALARALERIAVGGDEREPGASMAEVARRALARYRGEGEETT